MDLKEIFPGNRWELLHLMQERVQKVSEEDFLNLAAQHRPDWMVFSPALNYIFKRYSVRKKIEYLGDFGPAELCKLIAEMYPEPKDTE